MEGRVVRRFLNKMIDQPDSALSIARNVRGNWELVYTDGLGTGFPVLKHVEHEDFDVAAWMLAQELFEDCDDA